MNPTPEQAEARRLFMAGDNLAVVAYAGAGKTSTLLLMANATKDRGQYTAFNRAIVDDAGRKMPDNVPANTAHSLAMSAVGNRYRHRLQGGRVRSGELARAMRMDPFVITYGKERKVLQPGYLASLVMRSVRTYCASADERLGPEHVPYVDGIDLPEPDGRRGWANNRELRAHLQPHLARTWADLSATDGTLPFAHDVYLKLWERSGPSIPAEFVLFDEAQDASPVMLSIVEQQADHAQLVFVGDPYQQIYDWRGAINALDNVPADATTYLTQSFRFGPAIAEVANVLLDALQAPKPLEGTPSVPSLVSECTTPDAVLTRTNAGALRRAMRLLKEGRRPCLLGGGTELVAFARAARELQQGLGTMHPDLACFTSWQQVLEYVEQDPQGDDLALQVGLVEDNGVDAILEAIEQMPAEADADVLVSTAHKAKGREWARVQIASDFKLQPGQEVLSPSELRLLYVAATRARNVLDPTQCGVLQAMLDPEPAQSALL